ncbi:MAG: ABC transporter permease [Bacteroidota bacterium]
MLRLISIEFFKLRYTRYFWALAGLFLVLLIAIPVGAHEFLDYLTDIGESPINIGIDANQIPLYDFIDLWQNLTWVYSSFSVFLGFIMLISIGNEFSYGTIKQNVIDGLSPTELFLSKLSFIGAMSLIATVAVFLIGLACGYLWSPVTEVAFIVKHLEFLPAYFFHLCAFQLLCLCVGLVVKRTGIALALLLFYIFPIEFIAVRVTEYGWKMPWLADLYPINALNNFIPNPFPKYILKETLTTVQFPELGIAVGYTVILGLLAFWLLAKRDLR